jgi:hypothetical protein
LLGLDVGLAVEEAVAGRARDGEGEVASPILDMRCLLGECVGVVAVVVAKTSPVLALMLICGAGGGNDWPCEYDTDRVTAGFLLGENPDC